MVALVMGPLYGRAGALLRDPGNRHRATVIGLLSAPWLIDSTSFLLVAVTDADRVASMTLAAIGYAAIGLCVLCFTSRSWRVGVRAFAVCGALVVIPLVQVAIETV
jgi:hypothetical protein